MTNTQLLIKVIKFYIEMKTDNGKKCPTVDEMREIVQLDDISKGLEKKASEEKKV
jgi:hypothetical protein